MYSPRNIFRKRPVTISGAIVALLNVPVLFGVWSITAEQLAGVNTALVALLGLFTYKSVTPVASTARTKEQT